MKIDWSDAPDWAEAVGIRLYKSGGVGHAFICPAGYNYKLELGKAAKCHPFNDEHAMADFSAIEFRPRLPKPWTGEGPPPVGIEIEALLPGLGNTTYFWQRAKVVHGALPDSPGEVLVFSLETTRPAWADEFRPIRTPEQIAAEAREDQAKALYCAINWDDGEGGWSRLLDARKDDYRKAVDEGWTMVPRA
jgi:hypothetical protein